MDEKEIKTLNKGYNLTINNVKKIIISESTLKDIIDEWESLLDAGFDDLSSLIIVKDNCSNAKVKNILESIIYEIKKGTSLDISFKKHQKYFPHLFIEVINVAIKSNDLQNGLKLLSNFIGDEIKTKDKLKITTLYPKIIGIVIFIVICVISKFIIPSYIELFVDNNIELNKISSILINAFKLIGSNLTFVILSFFFIFITFKLLKKSNRYNLFIINIKHHLPFISKNLNYFNAYAFCSMTELLWKNKLNKVEAIKIVKDSMNDVKIKSKLTKVYYEINNGLSISESLLKHNVFDNVLTKMFVIGEKNNMLIKNIENAVKYYRYKYQTQLKKTTTLLEPILLIIMSLFVMMIILVVFIPMMNAFRMVG